MLRARTGWAMAAVMAAAMMSASGAMAQSQSQDSQVPEPGATQWGRPKGPEAGMPAEMQRELAKRRNEQRQQDIKNDTDKLLELATELKQYVDKTNSNILSMDVVKKAEQIEKLAKQVKEKMKGQ